MRRAQEMWLALYLTPLATVAAISGHAPAGGCMLAMACDARVMVDGKYMIGGAFTNAAAAEGGGRHTGRAGAGPAASFPHASDGGKRQGRARQPQAARLGKTA